MLVGLKQIDYKVIQIHNKAIKTNKLSWGNMQKLRFNLINFERFINKKIIRSFKKSLTIIYK